MKFNRIVLALGTFAFATGAAVPGWSAPLPGTSRVKVILRPVYERSFKTETVLSKHFGAKTVTDRAEADYEAFSVIEVDSSRLESLKADARQQGYQVEAHPEWNLVKMPGKTINTLAMRLSPAANMARDDSPRPDRPDRPNVRGLHVVQFIGPMIPEWQAQLKSTGLQILGYIPENALLVAGSTGQINRATSLGCVQGIMPYDPSFRSGAAALQVRLNNLSASATQPASWYTVHIADTAGIASVLAKLEGKTHIGPTRFGSSIYYDVMLTSVEASDLLQSPFVVAIEDAPAPQVSGETQALALTGLTDGMKPLSPGGYMAWLTSAGVDESFPYKIALADTGFDDGFPPGRRRAVRIGPPPTVPPLNPYHPAFMHLRSTSGALSYTDYADDRAIVRGADPIGHGSLVAGLIFGLPPSNDPAAKDSDGFLMGQGIAPHTQLYMQRVFSRIGYMFTPSGGDNSMLQQVARDAAKAGASVQNHSWNNYLYSDQGRYSALARQADFIVRDADSDPLNGNQPLALTVAAGNICQGDASCKRTMVLPMATAKNVISMGATESYVPGQDPGASYPFGDTTINSCNSYHFWPDGHGGGTDSAFSRVTADFYAAGYKNVAAVSARGTLDGRIKPDLVVPAAFISSTTSQFDDPDFNPNSHPGFSADYPGFCHVVNRYYSMDTGTSFAAPQAAAACALVAKKNRRNFTPAMLKAILVGSAVSIKGGIDRRASIDAQATRLVEARPNAVQGFGRMSLEKTLGSSAQVFLDEGEMPALSRSGAVQSKSFRLVDPSLPAVLVLAWTDEPALEDAQTTLVNDLTLRVSSASGNQVYYGNQMDSATELSKNQAGASTAVSDHLNNVEMIVIPAGGTETMKLDVIADRVLPEGQSYAVYGFNISL